MVASKIERDYFHKHERELALFQHLKQEQQKDPARAVRQYWCSRNSFLSAQHSFTTQGKLGNLKEEVTNSHVERFSGPLQPSQIDKTTPKWHNILVVAKDCQTKAKRVHSYISQQKAGQQAKDPSGKCLVGTHVTFVLSSTFQFQTFWKVLWPWRKQNQ